MAQAVIEAHGNIALLRLSNSVTNAIGLQMVDDLQGAIEEIKSHYRGLVLAGGTKFFSIGLDLPQLLTLSKSDMSDFYSRFNSMVLELYTLPLPTICAMAGHAIAGGTILALACDFRYGAPEKKLMGLNEVKLGLPVPYLADLMLRQIVHDRIATPIVYEGEFMALPDARDKGLIDESVSAETLEDEVLERVSEFAAQPATAFAEIKANRVAPIRDRYAQNGRMKNETFLTCWFKPEAQQLLHEAAKRF